jgi:hypothetical protein
MQNWNHFLKSCLLIQADLVIRGLFICEFTYLNLKKWSKRPTFQSEGVFLASNLVFEVQYCITYLPQITWFTIISVYPQGRPTGVPPPTTCEEYLDILRGNNSEEIELLTCSHQDLVSGRNCRLFVVIMYAFT